MIISKLTIIYSAITVFLSKNSVIHLSVAELHIDLLKSIAYALIKKGYICNLFLSMAYFKKV